MNRVDVRGVYGKIEAQADFFRVNAGEFSQAGLDRWFEEALATMRTEGGRLPDGPTEFVLAPRGSAKVFLGALAPSTDAAGRSFPLIVFAEVDAEAVLGRLPAFAVSMMPFLRAAGALAVDGGRMAGAELTERAHALGAPDMGDAASAMYAAFAQQSADDLAEVLGRSPRALGYTLRTIGLACDQASKYGPDAASGVITVDAPAPTAVIRQLWLELTGRRLRWGRGLPSLLCLPPGVDAAGRMLITLGPPSASVFGYLANPRHRSPRFWPLRTDVNAALDQGLQALAPEQRRLVENPSVSLGELVTAFGV